MNNTATQNVAETARPKKSLTRFLKPLVFVICLVPIALVVFRIASGRVVDPIDALIHSTGEWSLRFLLITLCVTPIQIIFKWGAVAKLRRMLGLFVFFYASLHLAVWVALDQGLDPVAVVYAVVDKPFITLGMIVWLGLLALAVTSNRFSVRKLGVKWKMLHNWIYFLSVLAVVHFVWQVKSNEILEPAMYLGVLAGLLVWRFIRVVKR